MKTVFITLFLLCSFYAEAQSLENYKNSDTLYFYFSATKNQEKEIYKNDHKNHKDSLIRYIYLKNNKELISFRYSKYEDFDSMFAGITTYKKYHHKRFLRKNKYRLVTIDFLNDLSPEEKDKFVDARRWKKNFIIDEAETKKRKILVRRAFVSTMFSTNDNDDNFRIYQKRYIRPFYEELGYNDDFYAFIIPKKKNSSASEDLYILFEPSEVALKEDSYEYVVQQGDSYSEPRIQEQYILKLNIKRQVVFLQLTHKRKQSQQLHKKYDLFTKSYETVSYDDLNNFSEKELEDLFARTRNIYIVENFIDNEYVLPLLVKPTTEITDLIRNVKD